MKLTTWLIVVVAVGQFVLTPAPIHALDNGLALTPPMGWLSWERFTCTTDCETYPRDCINSQLYTDMANRMVDDGYLSAGYEYVNIDDCWSEMQRDQATGSLDADQKRFPGGIESLSQYVHARNLKLGLYGDCGTATCGGYPAQLKSEDDDKLADNYFVQDANQFASWGVDSFKFDGCNLDPAKAESICPQMANALATTNERPILLICEWPFYMLKEGHKNPDPKLVPNFELAQKACNAWRYYEDVEDSWLSILNIINFTISMQSTIVKYHGPGHWFDPDQLIVGNFALSLDEARAQMAIWSVWSAPLFMSNDLRQIEPEMAQVLKNKHFIAVDQDKMGVFGLMVGQSSDNRHQAFAKPVEPIKNGCPSFVIVYLNRDTLGNSQLISFELRNLLVSLPIDLAAERYAKVYPPRLEAPAPSGGGEFIASKCFEFLRMAMTKEPGVSVPLNAPLNRKPIELIEPKQVHFNIIDLFDDEKFAKTVPLNGNLSLRVNPSGVRAVKLIQA